jgi:hypothetical protein
MALTACLIAVAGCGGASQTVVTRTVDSRSAAAARAAAAAQLAAATHGASRTGQTGQSAPSATPAPSPTASAPAKSGAQAVEPGPLADADAICVRRNGELSGLSAQGANQQTPAAASRRAAIERRALAELAALHAPASTAHAYRQVLNYSRIMLGQAVQPSGASSSKVGEQVQLRLLVAAARAGVKHCYAVN